MCGGFVVAQNEEKEMDQILLGNIITLFLASTLET